MNDLITRESVMELLRGLRAHNICINGKNILTYIDEIPTALNVNRVIEKFMFKPYCDMTDIELINTAYKAPYHPGDILYVRETWHKYLKRVGNGGNCRLQEFYGYRASIANSEDAEEPWKPSLHMPKEAARLFLRVTNVRVERLQEITTNQIEQEGVETEYPHVLNGEEKKYAFQNLWNSTIKKSDLDRYGWDANPYVWVIEFERCEKPGSEV